MDFRMRPGITSKFDLPNKVIYASMVSFIIDSL